MTTLLSRPSVRPLLWAAPLAGVLAALVNVVLYLTTRGAFEGVRVGPQQVPFTAAPIALFSVVGALGAGAVYALLARLTRKANRIFAVVAGVVLLASFVTPFSIPEAPGTVVIVLNLMHVVVYALVMALVPRRGGRG